MTRLRVRLTRSARIQARAVESWWREHRPLSPDLFSDELAEALELLCLHPRAGTTYESRTVPDARRLLLRSSRYHVYYRLQGDILLVMSVWSAIRGAGPDLKRLR